MLCTLDIPKAQLIVLMAIDRGPFRKSEMGTLLEHEHFKNVTASSKCLVNLTGL